MTEPKTLKQILLYKLGHKTFTIRELIIPAVREWLQQKRANLRNQDFIPYIDCVKIDCYDELLGELEK